MITRRQFLRRLVLGAAAATLAAEVRLAPKQVDELPELSPDLFHKIAIDTLTYIKANLEQALFYYPDYSSMALVA